MTIKKEKNEQDILRMYAEHGNGGRIAKDLLIHSNVKDGIDIIEALGLDLYELNWKRHGTKID